MSHPVTPSENEGDRTAAWPDNSDSDATQVVRSGQGGYDSPPPPSSTQPDENYRPYAGPQDAPETTRDTGDRETRAESYSGPTVQTSAPQVGAPQPGRGNEPAQEPGGWSPSYSGGQNPPSGSNATAMYPPSPPGYAPAGYPPAYAPPANIEPPPSAAVPTRPASRVGPSLLSAVIGLILSAGGVYLMAKFGIATAGDLATRTSAIKNPALAILGAVLLLAAVILNGWAPWATIISGVALAGIGGWALFDVRVSNKLASSAAWWLPGRELAAWSSSGFSLGLGVALLGASAAAMMARAAGKRDGAIVGRNEPTRPNGF